MPSRRSLRTPLLVFVLLAGLPGTSVAGSDVVPPTGTISINGGATYTNRAEVTLSVPATDDASGVVSVSISNDGVTWIDLAYEPSLQWFLREPLIQGKNTIRARWSDAEGNTSSIAKASIVVDSVRPVVTVEFQEADATTVTFALTANDAHGIAGVRVSCDNGATSVEVEYADLLIVGLRDDGIGCVGYGYKFITVEIFDPAGNAVSIGTNIALLPELRIETPLRAVTGEPFTVRPIFPDDYSLPAGGGCRWNFRWGDDESLDRQTPNETFGALWFEVPSSGGGCAPWTFPLPWVPYRQYDVNVAVFDDDRAFFAHAGERFTATVGSLEQRILSSSLPIAQVLPSTYTPTVGSPITYTRYLIGGATNCCDPRWIAIQGNSEHPEYWTQAGGATFTVTPTKPLNLIVTWDRASGDYLLGATFDPPVRYRDKIAPTATAPKQRSGHGALRGKVPVTLQWTGADKGWGVASYQLQQSRDGGAWTAVPLTDPQATRSVGWLTAGHNYRIRVRAIDKAGNVGAWATGASFAVTARPRWPVAVGH